MKGTDIEVRATSILNDTGNVRWSRDELLLWINDARREMAVLRPSVFGASTKINHELSDGAYQVLPETSSAFAVVDVPYNLDAAGKPGSSIRLAKRESLDTYNPRWRTDTGKTVQNWLADDTNPRAFWVYPAVQGGKVLICVSVSPADIATLDETAAPSDIYLVPMVNYVLYRAYSKDAEHGGNAQLAAGYLSLFSAAFTNQGAS